MDRIDEYRIPWVSETILGCGGRKDCYDGEADTKSMPNSMNSLIVTRKAVEERIIYDDIYNQIM